MNLACFIVILLYHDTDICHVLHCKALARTDDVCVYVCVYMSVCVCDIFSLNNYFHVLLLICLIKGVEHFCNKARQVLGRCQRWFVLMPYQVCFTTKYSI